MIDGAALDATPSELLRPGSALARRGAIALAARVGGVVLSMMTSVLTARMLGPEGKGILAFLSAMTSLVVRMGSVGLDGAFTHFYLARRRPLVDCVGAVVWLTAVAGVIAAVSCMSAVCFSPWLSAGAPLYLSIPYSAAIPSLFALFVSTYIFFGTGRELFFGLFDVGYRATILLLLAVALLLLRASVTAAVWIQIAAAVVFSGIAVFSIGRTVQWRFPLSVPLVGEMLQYGVRYYLYSTLRYGLCYGGVLAAGVLLTRSDTGIFSISLMLGEGMLLFAGAINLAFYPSVAVVEEPIRYTLRTSAHMLWLGMLVGGVIGIAARFAIALLYGNAFAMSVPAFFYMLPGLVLLGVEQVISSFYASTRMPWRVIAAMGGSVVLGCLLAATLGPRLGVVGVAISTGVAQSAAAAFVIGTFLTDVRSFRRDRPTRQWT